MNEINYATFNNPVVTRGLIVEDGEQLVRINYTKQVERKNLPPLDVTISMFYTVTPVERRDPKLTFIREEFTIPLPGVEGRVYPRFACEAMIDRSLVLDLMEQNQSRLVPYLESVSDLLWSLNRQLRVANNLPLRGRKSKKDKNATKTEKPTTEATQGQS